MPDIQEITVDELKHLVSDRAIQGETMLLNMGPQHPSTHGVLRLLLELDGETVINCIPDIGFLHTGIEKNMEAKTYQKAEVMSDRLDYLNTVGNNLAYSLAVEKLVDLDVPARAQAIRVILAELTRFQSHLVWLGTAALDLAAMSMFLYCFREREYILDVMEMCSGQRMMTTYIRPGGLWRDVPVEFEAAVRNILKTFPKRDRPIRSAADPQPAHARPHLGIGKLTGEECLNFGVTGPMLRASGVKWDLRKNRPYSGYEQYDFEVPTRTEGDVYARYLVRLEEMRQSLTHRRAGAGQAADGSGALEQLQVRPAAAFRDRRQHGSAHPPLQAVDRRVRSSEGCDLFCGRIAARRTGRLPGIGWRPQAVPHPLAHALVR